MSLIANQNSADNLVYTSSKAASSEYSPLTFPDTAQSAILSSLAKRSFDIVFSAAILVLLLPVLLLIALSIKLESRGPVLFRQTRWGRDQKLIVIYKFRSMRQDLCDHSGVTQTTVEDPRITRVGAFLRKTSLDELPQFINVLKGDLSVVGPRCHAIGMFAGGQRYEDLVPEYHQRHTVRPGITGLAQVRGWRGPTTDPVHARARIVSDLYYIKNYSFLLDMKIVIATIKNEMSGGTGL
ncbi:sugar transferase [Rhizobium sp. FY34]|uniref:sugar transferase n=1 Tax=Rhizobium sp. FY34 TaxID=2562309 RepID=UPI0010C0F5D6|nr:sugar transferase [Rhizobium sp. FY34]